ncbi:hypothetical protein NDA18_002972 [Ustilago nuda]|nr:hypothetical protein NDA18_002972 [Ustilago nuda]
MSGALAGLSQYANSDSDAESASDGDEVKVKSKLSRPEALAPLKITKICPTASTAPADLPLKRVTKRKLPPLEADSLQRQVDYSPSDLTPAPASNSSKKVARGEWLCYCFVDVPLDPSSSALIRDCHKHLQEQLGTSHTLLNLIHSDASPGADPAEEAEHLHVSLTRPFTVRSSERDEYAKIAKAELQRLKEKIGSFPFSFSRIAYLNNDDASRHFMVLEVGSGRDQFVELSTALSKVLHRAFRAKAYYEEARFHASTSCLETTKALDDDAEPPELREAGEALGPRFSDIVNDVEKKWGPQLRKHPPTWAARVGIQVANRITYVDL